MFLPSIRGEVAPFSSLLLPIGDGGDWADVAFGDGIFAGFHAWQKQDGFLNVRGEVEQRRDLGHPSSRDVPKSRQFRVVGDNAVANESFEADGSAINFATRGNLGGTWASCGDPEWSSFWLLRPWAK